jgi:hypothetical protein
MVLQQRHLWPAEDAEDLSGASSCCYQILQVTTTFVTPVIAKQTILAEGIASACGQLKPTCHLDIIASDLGGGANCTRTGRVFMSCMSNQDSISLHCR